MFGVRWLSLFTALVFVLAACAQLAPQSQPDSVELSVSQGYVIDFEKAPTNHVLWSVKIGRGVIYQGEGEANADPIRVDGQRLINGKKRGGNQAKVISVYGSKRLTVVRAGTHTPNPTGGDVEIKFPKSFGEGVSNGKNGLVTLKSVTVTNITTRGANLVLYGDGRFIKRLPIPQTAPGASIVVPIDQAGVGSVQVNVRNAFAVDDVIFEDEQAGGESGDISGTVSIVGDEPNGLSTFGTSAPFVPGEVIVRFRSDLDAQQWNTLSALGNEVVRVRSLGGIGNTAQLLRASVRSDQETLELIEALRARPEVLYAHPNYLLEAYATPNDPLYSAQWHLPAINLPAAWDQTTGSSNVTVAVLDSGILPDHPDLSSKLESGYDFVSDDRRGDGDGRDSDPTDPRRGNSHGSHVAGTVAAATDNGVGVAGVSWGSRILPVRVLGVDFGTLADIVDGILWSVGESVPGVPDNPNPADVLNLSLGAPFLCSDAPVFQDAFDQVNAAGATVVVAAGNGDEDASGISPASCGGVITVGATNLQSERAYYSNFGARIDVMAPGGDVTQDSDGDDNPDGVLSTMRNGATGEYTYIYLDGTSMASPHVAGVIALMKSVRPSLSGAEARDILQRTARPISDSSCSVGCGAGLIDAAAALRELEAPAEPNFTLSLSTTSLSLIPGNSAEVEVRLDRTGGFDDEVALSVSGTPPGLTASFAPETVNNDSSMLTLTASTGLEGDYTLEVQGVGGGIIQSVPLSLFIERGDDTDLDVTGTVVYACPVLADTCDARQLPSARVTQSGTSAPYMITNVPVDDYYVYAWKDANSNQRIDEGEFFGMHQIDGERAVVSPPATDVGVYMIPALGVTGAPPFK